MIDLQSEEMLKEAMDLAAMNTVRKNKDYLNERYKLIRKRNQHDNEYIKNANNLVDRLQAEKNEILEENRRSGEIINEATIRNVERLNALDEQMNAAYQRIGDSEAQIQMLQLGKRFQN
jgi:hypothetical protein